MQLQSSGPLTRPHRSRPIANIDNNALRVLPVLTEEQSSSFTKALTYYKSPENPRWSYIVVNEKPLYNANSSIHFELHKSEEYDLILKILQMAGIAIKEFSLTQAAGQAEVNIVSQQKQ